MDAIGPKKTLVEQTYDILVDAICSGELEPGERLTQDEIAARLDVSRQPVNSAIAILKANGLVEDTGRRGVIVSAIEAEQFTSIYEFRAVVEPFAVTLAARRLADDAEDEARAILRRGRAATHSGDIKELVQADMSFHEMLYRWSGNHVVESSMKLNWQHMRRGMAEVLRDPSAAIPSWDDHEAIVDGLIAGEAERAAHVMKDHIEKAHAKTMKALRRVPSLNSAN